MASDSFFQAASDVLEFPFSTFCSSDAPSLIDASSAAGQLIQVSVLL